MTDPQAERAYEAVLRAYKPKLAPPEQVKVQPDRKVTWKPRRSLPKSCGHQDHKWKCSECVREYQRNWMRKNGRRARPDKSLVKHYRPKDRP